ncbi:Na(+)-translocating NADH-quinone reductase subunit C [Microbulbifer thermotolerans]|uniref:Na(+)-translocating NADH-quinone reductase subunit C n=1 Tax=Microbulbifer thermotolerans TaxID=252514 RepID=A0A143HMY3_MICTH|nr:Na(+)-translocating NADH-quinone reductase subunit C [Microbulbifer thermotolerans]AMX02632.1 NADH:ubiquinone reductase (Na(+)-transporting) subunit C [Microbulbifer thermotolerans]MCX2779783.1 Na(+)-translocating NADH-quinone reductase subunit C [Microbulbifer thermotolerans]MCX2782285.1 Na(+)-translocating NADH-quinone reductase subunit C [Microbulbifer thermotolerans]MCX2794451.1 Na(+)-translocating NADH-quinone reductase subunit C [Microbulbifer thermotolerans]MCX2800438.1 Na(+)-translo
MANKDSVKGTLLVALALCIVCSVVVSTAAVMLKPAQQANAALDMKRNVLMAGGLIKDPRTSASEVEKLFESVAIKYVDLKTGKFTDEAPAGGSGRAAAKVPSASEKLSPEKDKAKLIRRENIKEVYLVEQGGELQKIILPVRGYGLWGTLYGFLALESDLNTVAGLGFYEHKETPGLGGEVDNPIWKAKWLGKKIYDANGNVAIDLVKGGVDLNSPNAEFQVDALSGATLTSNGVDNLLHFWLGSEGFGPFLKNLKAGEA